MQGAGSCNLIYVRALQSKGIKSSTDKNEGSMVEEQLLACLKPGTQLYHVLVRLSFAFISWFFNAKTFLFSTSCELIGPIKAVNSSSSSSRYIQQQMQMQTCIIIIIIT